MSRKKVRNFIIYALVVAMLVTIYMLQFHPRFQEVTITYSDMLPASDMPLKFNPEVEVHKLLDEVNDERRAEGLSKLEFDENLNEYAAIRAEECDEKWSHTRPNGQLGIDILPKDKWRGENLAMNYDHADDVVDAWMESPSHKDNILFEEFNECGIAYYQTRISENYWCILFTD